MLRALKFKYQKVTRGFSDDEIWNLEYTIAKFILPRLKEFRKQRCAFPGDMDSMEEWESVIDKMIYAFDTIVNDDFMLDLSYDDKVKEWEKVTIGVQLFNEYFQSLWY